MSGDTEDWKVHSLAWKSLLEGKQVMESGRMVKVGFDKPGQGTDGAGTKDRLTQCWGAA